MGIIKRLLIPILKKIPGVGAYLSEKDKMQQTIFTLEKQKGDLEKNIKTNQGKLYSFTDKEPHIRFITNQLDATGAPHIFRDVIKEFRGKYPELPATLSTFRPVNEEYREEIEKLGIETIIHDRIDTEITFTKNDIVVLNSAAHSFDLKQSIFSQLKNNSIRGLVWYIQEDWPDTFFNDEERQLIHKLLSQGRIIIFNPAEKSLKNIRKFFNDQEHIKKQVYKVQIPSKYHRARQSSDFDKLTFIMIGKTGGGIKGHLPILYAFLNFKKIYYDNRPSLYRNFELRFIGLEEDFLSRQIIQHASSLGESFRYYTPLSHRKTLDVISEANITICYSIRECLPIFVFEGMISGHPLLRKNVSGMEEQLEDGVNGYLLDANNFYNVLSTIERILNKKSTSNAKLLQMSKKSYNIARKFETISYDTIINEIVALFNRR